VNEFAAGDESRRMSTGTIAPPPPLQFVWTGGDTVILHCHWLDTSLAAVAWGSSSKLHTNLAVIAVISIQNDSVAPG
jgi:hypothetical protein